MCLMFGALANALVQRLYEGSVEAEEDDGADGCWQNPQGTVRERIEEIAHLAAGAIVARTTSPEVAYLSGSPPGLARNGLPRQSPVFRCWLETEVNVVRSVKKIEGAQHLCEVFAGVGEAIRSNSSTDLWLAPLRKPRMSTSAWRDRKSQDYCPCARRRVLWCSRGRCPWRNRRGRKWGRAENGLKESLESDPASSPFLETQASSRPLALALKKINTRNSDGLQIGSCKAK